MGDRAMHHLLRIAHAIEENMDGTSGAIYGLFFNGLALHLRDNNSEEIMAPSDWSIAAAGALKSLQAVTPARSGDRTLMDALEPFVEALSGGLEGAVEACRQGMMRTKGMKPAFGRAVYVNEVGWEQVPDPGAVGILALAEGLLAGLT